MSITIVQQANTVFNTGSGSLAFANPTQVGNTVVIVRIWLDASTNNIILSDSDNAGNSYGDYFSGDLITITNHSRVEIFAAFNPNGGSPVTPTLSMQTFTQTQISGTAFVSQNWMFEVAGLTAKSQATLFTGGVIPTNTAVPPTSGTTQPVYNEAAGVPSAGTDNTHDNLLIAGVCAFSPGANGVNSPWILTAIQNGFAVAYQIVSAGITFTREADFSNSVGDTYSGTLAVMQAAASALPTTGNIRVIKATVPSGSVQPFTFHPDWEGSFALSDAQSHLSPNLAPGSYSITEDAVPNWTTATSIDPTAIVVTAGVTTVITFTNTFVPPVPPPGPVCYADGIIPTGAIDGVNTSFTLPSAPNPPGSLVLSSDTNILAPGVGFNLNFVLSGTQLTLVYPPKTSLVAWYRIICGAQQSIPPLYKLNPDQAFDDNVFTSTPTAINSTYFTYGFVNAAKSQQNPLLGFHRKRFSEIQLNVNGSGQFVVTTFPNYILKKDLSYNPYAYVVPPIILQTDPPDDLIRPLNSVGNRVYVMFQTNAVGAAFDISKTIMVGVMDSYNVVNPNV